MLAKLLYIIVSIMINILQISVIAGRFQCVMLLIDLQTRVHAFLLILTHHLINSCIFLAIDRIITTSVLRLKMVKSDHFVQLFLVLGILQLLSAIAVHELMVDRVNWKATGHSVLFSSHIEEIKIGYMLKFFLLFYFHVSDIVCL